MGDTACFSAGNWPRHAEDILFIYSYSNDSYFIRCFTDSGFLAIKYGVGGCNWLDTASTISKSGGSSTLQCKFASLHGSTNWSHYIFMVLGHKVPGIYFPCKSNPKKLQPISGYYFQSSSVRFATSNSLSSLP